MENITLGQKIAQLRKEKNMTQLELAQKLNITDKAVSKWERDLSCPDINTFPKLAKIFEVSIEELLSTEKPTKSKDENSVLKTVLGALPLAMGVAVFVLSIIKTVPVEEYIGLLGIGLIALAIKNFLKK